MGGSEVGGVSSLITTVYLGSEALIHVSLFSRTPYCPTTMALISPSISFDSAPLPIILSVVFGTLFVLTVFSVLVFWLRRRRHRRRERELRAARRRNHGAARAVSYGFSSLGSPLGGQAGLLDEADDEIDVDLDDPFNDRPPSIGGRDAREMSMTFLGRAGSLLMLASRDVAGEVAATSEGRRLERSLTGTDKRALRAADLDLQHRELLDHQRDNPMEADLLGLGGADGGEILRRKMEGWAAVARQRQDEERGTMGLPPSSVVLEEKSPFSDENAEQRRELSSSSSPLCSASLSQLTLCLLAVIALPPRLRLPLHITTSLPFLPHHLPSEPPLSSTSSGTRSPYSTTTGPFSAATSTTNHSSRGLPHYHHGPRSTTSSTVGVPLLSAEYSPATATGTTLRRQATDGGHLMGIRRSIDEDPHLQDDDGVGDAASLRTARSEDPPAYAWS